MYAVIGVYGELDKAQHAVSELVRAGTARHDIKVTTHEFISIQQPGGQGGDGHIFGQLNNKYPDAGGDSYTSEVLKGGTVVTLELPSEDVAKMAESVLRLSGAARVERRNDARDAAARH